MNLTISGHHLEITPAIRSHVENKLDRMKRNFDNVIDISVLLAVDNIFLCSNLNVAVDFYKRYRRTKLAFLIYVAHTNK